MKATDVINPTPIKYPIAYAGLKNTIPLAATGSNLASITEGFPEMTMKSLADGGLPPYGQDFNGLFYMISDQKAFFQDGGYITFDSTVSTLIGGYPSGAILDYYNPSTNYYTKVESLIDDNTYDFVTTPSYIDNAKWRYVDFGTGANEALSNLSVSGNSRLHALKGYLDEGELLTDSEGLADVIKYAHSTFDLSKFTVVGSPNITDDGIASGFSSSNYIQTSDFDFSKAWEIKGQFKIASIQNVNPIVKILGKTYSNIIYYHSTNSAFVVNNYTTGDINNTINNISLSANVDYNYIWGWDKTKYYIKLYQGSILLGEHSVNSGDTMSIATQNRAIQFGYQSETYASWGAFNGSMDLKQSSVTINGVPVFSGNKTGIDTVKADDYTVVGTPTISADGIASGFSTSNYITANLPYAITLDKIDVYGSFTTGSTYTTFGIILNIGSTTQLANALMQLGIRAGGKVIGIGCHNDTTWTGYYSTNAVSDNTKYYYHLYYNNGIKLDILTDGVWENWISDNPTVNSSISQSLLTFGSSGSDGGVFNGSIDLNAFKSYFDRDLVYQPCLKIPYTKSAPQFGSKIANAVYRDRVQDAYEQGYPQRYYTLDDDNENFTLPQGELYGMIENKLDVKTATTDEVDTVYGWGLPDYTNKIQIATGATSGTYTCPDKGWLYCVNVEGSPSGGGNAEIIINGLTVARAIGATSYHNSINNCYAVDKNDVIEYSMLYTPEASTRFLYFIPKKGA